MSVQSFLDGRVVLHAGDCRDVIKTLADNSIDAVVTDPPYALVSIQKRFGKPGSAPAKDGDVYARASAGFMGKQWDTGETAFAAEFWCEVLRVLKPGGHVIAFAGTRTYHRLACAIEDAGFEIRDMVSWLYGSGFPKSHDVSKAIDKAAGAEREIVAEGKAVKRMIPGADQIKSGWEKNDERGYVPQQSLPATAAAAAWQGFGTALKPACEPMVLARKPLIGTVAANVLAHGVGALNIDGCRVPWQGEADAAAAAAAAAAVGFARSRAAGKIVQSQSIGKESRAGESTYFPELIKGRWPANVVHDGSDEVASGFPDSDGQQGDVRGNEPSKVTVDIYGSFAGRIPAQARGDSGSAARFFYSAKADADDRIGSKHPTVKPVDLMRWLVRLVTPPNGTVLDPFSGSGTTGEAAWREGFSAILIEREDEYRADIARRMDSAQKSQRERKEIIARVRAKPSAALPLFGDASHAGGAGGFTASSPINRTGRADEMVMP